MFHGSTADYKILETITRRLQRSSFSQLKLTAAVNRGTVAITGILQYEGQRDSIIKALRTVAGVRQVLDRLQVALAVQNRVDGNQTTPGRSAEDGMLARTGADSLATKNKFPRQTKCAGCGQLAEVICWIPSAPESNAQTGMDESKTNTVTCEVYCSKCGRHKQEIEHTFQ